MTVAVRGVVLDHPRGHPDVGAAGPAELPKLGSGLVVLVDDRRRVGGVDVVGAVVVDGLGDVLGEFALAWLVLAGDGAFGLLVVAVPTDGRRR